MPDMSNIDSEKILGAVSQIDGLINRIRGCVGKFADAIENLDKGWVSDVKAPFMAGYQTDWEAMQEMISQLSEVNEGLKNAAVDFDKTEEDILSGINALSKG